MLEALKCPKCQGEMVAGFIPDRTGAKRFTLDWVSGAPTPRLGSETLFGVNIPEEQCYPVVAYACARCGFVELYVRTNPDDLGHHEPQ